MVNMSELDFPQIIKSSYDPINGALKTVSASGTVTEVELSHLDGDSVYQYGGASQQATAVLSSGASGEVIAPFSIVGLSKFQVYGNVVTTAVSTAALTLQVSPEDSGSIWFSTALSVTPTGAAGTVSAGTLLTGIGRRARLIVASGSITSGTVQAYVIAQA